MKLQPFRGILAKCCLANPRLAIHSLPQVLGENNRFSCSALVVGFMVLCVTFGNAANDYYIDSRNGNDGNTGRTYDQRWRSLSKIHSDAVLSAGSHVYLVRGSLWHESLPLPTSGSSGNRIYYEPYPSDSTDPDPIIDLGGAISGLTWRRESSSVYSAETAFPGRMWFDGVEHGISGSTDGYNFAESGTTTPNARYRYYYGTDNRLYLYVPADQSPELAYTSIYQSNVRSCSWNGRSYVTFKHLQWHYGDVAVELQNCDSLSFDHCKLWRTNTFMLFVRMGSDNGIVNVCAFDRNDTVQHSWEYGGSPLHAGGNDGIAIQYGSGWDIGYSTFRSPAHAGVEITGEHTSSTADYQSRNNKVHDCRFVGEGDYDRAFNILAWQDGGYTCPASYCENNEFFRNWVDSCSTVSQLIGQNNQVYYNLFTNQRWIPFNRAEDSWRSACVELSNFREPTAVHNQIVNNTFANLAASAIRVTVDNQYGAIKNNLIFNPGAYSTSPQQHAYHIGLFIEPDLPNQASTDTILNNLIYSPLSDGTVVIGQIEEDAGNPTPRTVGYMYDHRGSNAVADNLSADPQLNADCRVSTISAAINQGALTLLTADYFGTPVPFGGKPEIGAYESVNLRADLTDYDVQLTWDSEPSSSDFIGYKVAGPGGTATFNKGASSHSFNGDASLLSAATGYQMFVSTATKDTIRNDFVSAIAPDFTISSNTTWKDLVYAKHTVTVNSGSTLILLPGTRVVFKDTSNASFSLLANGNLIARGKPDKMIYFTTNTIVPGRSSWGDVQLSPGTTDTIEYASASYAQIGIGSQSVGAVIRNDSLSHNWHGLWFDTNTPTAPVYHNKCFNNGSAGIYVYGRSPILRRNISQGNNYGLWCTNGGSSNLDSNTIKLNASDGLHCESSAQAYLMRRESDTYWYGGYNLIDMNSTNYNSNAIYAGYQNYIQLGAGAYGGYNDIVGYQVPPGRYAVRAYSSSTVLAQSNYWGGVSPRTYNDGSCSIDCSGAIGQSVPSGGFGKIGAGPGVFPQTPLDSAFILAMEGKNEEAIALYNRVCLNPQAKDSMRILGFLLASGLYQRLGRGGFCEDFLTGAAPTQALATASNDLRVVTRDLEALWRAEEGNAEQALAIMGTLSTLAPENPALVKHALITRAQILAHDLGRKDDALALVAELEKTFSEKDPAVEDLAFMINFWTRSGVATAHPAPGKELASQKMAMPASYSLSEAYPNPFNPSTSFRLALPVASALSLVVYDLLGREVACVAEGAYEAGYHTFHWDAHASSGRPVASGIYFARLQVKGTLGRPLFVKTNRLLLMK